MNKELIAQIIQPYIETNEFISDWGIANNHIPISYNRFENWISENKHGPLKYLSDERKDKRKSLKEIFPDAKSVLMFAFDYSIDKHKLNNFNHSKDSNGLKISSYTLGFKGLDYHQIVKSYLTEIMQLLSKSIRGLECKLTLDTSPVLERDFAYQAGLGWFGKNSMLISKKKGSFQILGGIILNIEIEVEQKNEPDHCGQCTRCICACPTLAIDPLTRTIDSSICISTFTIEIFKDVEPPQGYNHSNGAFFGCDICQEVCPWNKRLLRNENISEMYDFSNSNETKNIHKYLLTPEIPNVIDWLENISNREFRRIFKNTPLERTGRVGILKNIKALNLDS
ncbi:MAG: tRNA epoxyqueuosine(34) reductase QueG [Halobacteriovoraceae bacterium]|nr:tRNA epoxyqueuosine(34) reductase QueG [Halobacteriovoraceae bacterium]